MLTSLQIKNFKSWKNTGEMRFAPITCFFGANGSGKTSILQLLLMLKQTVESPDRAQVLFFGDIGDNRTYVDLGTFRELVHRDKPDSPPTELAWSLTWTLPEPLEVDDPERRGEKLFSTEHLHFNAVIRDVGIKHISRLIVDKFEYRFVEKRWSQNYTFGMRRRNGERDEYELIHSCFEIARMPGRPWPLPAPVKCYGFPAQAVGYYRNAGFLPTFELAFEELFGRVYYLGPLRDYPSRQYIWAGGQPSDVGRRGERAIDALLASRERMSEENVSRWLNELGLTYSFSIQPVSEGSNLHRIYVQKTSSSKSVLIMDAGFGVSQILPVLVLCYYVPEGSTIILEHPEMHLHPKVQADLADVLIEAVKTRRVQIILESHSEHLLLRLQRRIAEQKLSDHDTNLYFCRMVDGDSELTRLELNPFGHITNWPQDFFGDAFGERVKMIESIIQRRRKENS